MIRSAGQRNADRLIFVAVIVFIAAFGFGLFAQTIVQERRCRIDEVFQIFDRQYHCYEVEPVEEPTVDSDLTILQVWHDQL